MLGCVPTKAQRKGDVFRNPRSGRERIARFGNWLLEVADRSPCDPDAQVAELLAKLTQDLDVWRSITGSYRADIFLGLFLKESNEEFSLSPATLLALGSRGIEASFDVYGPMEEESGQPDTTGNAGEASLPSSEPEARRP